MTCPATLGPLHCTVTTPHEPHHGCVFVSTSGVAHGPREGI